jgi:two-component system, OmpR family, KDP operon response regulator KdpE
MPQKRRILIVEDEAGIRNVHTIFFELQGFEVDTVVDGSSAIERVRAKDYEVVVLDLGLPDIDGLDVLQEIRSFSSVPVIVMTVRTDARSINESLKRGATDYMNKPFNPETLLRRINGLSITPAH